MEMSAFEDLIPPGELILANGITGYTTLEAAVESFHGYGVDQVKDWVRRGYISPQSRVLDVGCGLGRVARPLAGFLTTGSYIGIDIVKSSIDWCAGRYARFTNFSFVHADLANSHYAAEAAPSATNYRFPVETETIDFIWTTSVFTHMRLAAISKYLNEMARVATPACLIWNTFLLLDAISEPLARSGTPDGRRLIYPIEGGLCLSEENPDLVVAVYLDRIKRAHEDCGLEILHVGFGGWSGRPDAIAGGQDVILSRRRS